MNFRAHHFAAYLLAGALFLSTGTWFAVHTPPAEAACGTGSSVVVTSPSNSSGTTGPLSGIRTFRAYSTPTAASGMTFMIVAPNQKPLGEAVQSGSEWKLDWDTRNLPNGAYHLIAVAHFGTATTLDCASPVTSFTVHNNATQAPKLQAVIVPSGWQTPVGTSRTFSVDAIYTDQYGRQSHVAPSTTTPPRWVTTIGAVSAEFGPSTVLRSGVTAGLGHLKAQVTHGGLTALATAEIKVTPPPGAGTVPSPSPAPTVNPAPTTPGSGTATDTNTRLATMPTIFRPAEPTNSAPVVPLPSLSCLEKKIGTARFNEISSGKTEPTAAERRLAAACFSGPAPIPAVLAPVAPSGVSGLEQAKDLVSVGSIKNTTITNAEGKKITGVLLSGKGAPDSNIFIYIFSDPLVLRAQTDSQGAWSYVLETPLEPGKHEVYAVAEKDSSTFVRSQAIPVQIAAAADSPDGSLIIERTWSPAQIGFVIIAALMVLASLAVVLSIRRRHHHASAVVAGATTAPAPVAAPSVATPPRTSPQVAVPAPGQTFHPAAPKSSAPSHQSSTTGNGPAA